MHNYVLLLYHVASIYYMYVGLQNVVAWRYFWNIWELRKHTWLHRQRCNMWWPLWTTWGISEKDKKKLICCKLGDTQATAILLGKSSWTLGFREYTKAKSSMYPIFSDSLTVGKIYVLFDWDSTRQELASCAGHFSTLFWNHGHVAFISLNCTAAVSKASKGNCRPWTMEQRS